MGRTTFGLCVLLLLACFAAAQSVAVPSSLRIEWATNPIQVDNPFPRFSWEVLGAQIAYRVVVSDVNLSRVVWDSGNVSSSITTSVYAGSALASDQDYTWEVSSSNASGAWTTSPPAYFGTALLNQAADWQGVWIGGSNQLAANFSLAPSPVARARAYVTAVGCYELWINGEHVSRGGLNASDPPSFINPGIR